MDRRRCKWAETTPELMKYHDNEYGFRINDDKLYFERLILEIFQAGLSWQTILKKRNAFREAFDGFDFYKIADYKEKKIIELLNNKSIIRNKLKINSTIYNAERFIMIVQKFGSFDIFINSKPINDRVKILKIFKDNFKFIGPLIVEEFMMSVGFWKINHDKECFLYKK